MRKNLIVFGMSCLLMVASTECLFASANKIVVEQQAVAPKDLIGRWDITVDENGKPAPSWLEVKLSGFRTLVGYFVASSGSARPIAEVKFDNGKFKFEIP